LLDASEIANCSSALVKFKKRTAPSMLPVCLLGSLASCQRGTGASMEGTMDREPLCSEPGPGFLIGQHMGPEIDVVAKPGTTLRLPKRGHIFQMIARVLAESSHEVIAQYCVRRPARVDKVPNVVPQGDRIFSGSAFGVFMGAGCVCIGGMGWMGWCAQNNS